jgi:hypothetical protein
LKADADAGVSSLLLLGANKIDEGEATDPKGDTDVLISSFLGSGILKPKKF